MTGTNFPNGVAERKQYSGTTSDKSRLNATTKFISRQAVIRCGPTTAETQTEFTLPTNAIVNEVYLNVITVDATETVDVGTMGTSNDPNGFLTTASVATAGLVRASLADGALTRGALLVDDEDGAGALVPTSCVTAGGDPVSHTGSAGSDTAVFDIIIDYIEVVTEAN